MIFYLNCELLSHIVMPFVHLFVNQATERVAFALLATALILAFFPGKYMVLLIFLEIFTRYSPPRKASTERWMRRLREWWFSIPAAPVVLERDKEEKRK